MIYNAKSPYEKPLSECPARCADCSYFNAGICIANGMTNVTYSFCDPKNRSVPFPLNCFWWYANSVFSKMSANKIKETIEQRFHLFVEQKMLSEFPHGKEREIFLHHIHRPGGCGLIDFEGYPKAREIYNEIVRTQKI